MFTIAKPSEAYIRSFVEHSMDEPFSYEAVGATRSEETPPGFVQDHNRIRLGTGTGIFDSAKRSLSSWKMFAIPWVALCWPSVSIAAGQTVAVVIRHFGFYSINAARIVYVIDEPHRFGFASGTLPEHGETGEERFMVTMDERTEEVTYDLFAFSRPNHLAAKIGYPIVRSLQRQFASASLQAMKDHTLSLH